MREFAKAYAVVVAMAVLWALYIEITMQNSVQEHVLPGIVLAFLAFPASLTLNTLYDQWPELFTRTFVQMGWLTICAAGQVGMLFFLAAFLPNGNDGA